MLITSINNNKVKEWKKLNKKKERDKRGLFLIEGEHLILEAYKKGYLEELILEKDYLLSLSVNTTYVTNEIIKYISSLTTPSNVLGVCKKLINHDKLGDKLLLIDGIQNPSNLGTIIRSAVAFNIDTIVLGAKTVDLYNNKCTRANQGMMFHLNFIKADLLTFIPKLSNLGYKILGTRVTHGKRLNELDKLPKYALVVGNEGIGLSEEVKELCDELLSIEMNERCESLNVSIATSIILYQLDSLK